MNRKTTIYGLILAILVATASAARVGVAVDDGAGGITQRCYDVAEGSTADFVCSQTGFYCTYTWGPPMVCNIFGTGTDCEWKGYFWGFYTKASKDNDWEFSSTGVSDAEIEDKMMLGFNWQSDFNGVPFTNPSFCDVCDCGGKGKEVIPNYIGFATVGPAMPDGPVVINVTDNRTGKPIKNALVEFFEGMAGWTGSFLRVKTDGSGIAEARMPAEGEYGVRITADDYHHAYGSIAVEETTTTTTTSTTSTTTTTTASTTTTTLGHFLKPGQKTTTTLNPTTTVRTQPKVTGYAAKQPSQEGGLLARLLRWILW